MPLKTESWRDKVAGAKSRSDRSASSSGRSSSQHSNSSRHSGSGSGSGYSSGSDSEDLTSSGYIAWKAQNDEVCKTILPVLQDYQASIDMKLLQSQLEQLLEATKKRPLSSDERTDKLLSDSEIRLKCAGVLIYLVAKNEEYAAFLVQKLRECPQLFREKAHKGKFYCWMSEAYLQDTLKAAVAMVQNLQDLHTANRLQESGSVEKTVYIGPKILYFQANDKEPWPHKIWDHVGKAMFFNNEEYLKLFRKFWLEPQWLWWDVSNAEYGDIYRRTFSMEEKAGSKHVPAGAGRGRSRSVNPTGSQRSSSPLSPRSTSLPPRMTRLRSSASIGSLAANIPGNSSIRPGSSGQTSRNSSSASGPIGTPYRKGLYQTGSSEKLPELVHGTSLQATQGDTTRGDTTERPTARRGASPPPESQGYIQVTGTPGGGYKITHMASRNNP